MSQTKLLTTLDKIISLTSERDSGALDLSLAQILLAIADVKHTTMYNAGNITRAKHALVGGQSQSGSEVIPTHLVDALFDCLETAETSTIPLKDKKLTLFPLICSNQQPLAVIAVEEGAHALNHDLTLQILAIYNNFMSLMNENERDTLTGLLNRKTFDLKINKIIADLQRHKLDQKNDEPTYLAIFDIDHFKRVNDVHGHLIGDEVLLLLSQQMQKNFRDKDLLFRFGGEEFIGLFQCADDDTMMHILDRFRQDIAEYSFPQVGQVTISCGFTKIDAFDLSSKIIDRADIALYYTKHHGRNQIHQYEQLIASGALEEKNTSSGEIELF